MKFMMLYNRTLYYIFKCFRMIYYNSCIGVNFMHLYLYFTRPKNSMLVSLKQRFVSSSVAVLAASVEVYK